MTSDEALECAFAANEALRRAAEVWDATDLDAVQRCRDLVASAASRLEPLVHADPNRLPPELSSVLGELRQKIRRQVRLVDACCAFQDGLRLTLGLAGQEYAASSVPPASAGTGSSRALEA